MNHILHLHGIAERFPQEENRPQPSPPDDFVDLSSVYASFRQLAEPPFADAFYNTTGEIDRLVEAVKKISVGRT